MHLTKGLNGSLAGTDGGSAGASEGQASVDARLKDVSHVEDVFSSLDLNFIRGAQNF